MILRGAESVRGNFISNSHHLKRFLAILLQCRGLRVPIGKEMVLCKALSLHKLLATSIHII